MLQTFLFCLAVFLILFTVLLFARMILAELEDRTTVLQERATGDAA